MTLRIITISTYRVGVWYVGVTGEDDGYNQTALTDSTVRMRLMNGKRNVTIKLSDAQIRRAEALARRHGWTRTAYLERCVAESLFLGPTWEIGSSTRPVRITADK